MAARVFFSNCAPCPWSARTGSSPIASGLGPGTTCAGTQSSTKSGGGLTQPGSFLGDTRCCNPRLKSQVSERDEGPVDSLLKSGLPWSTANSANCCRARMDTPFKVSPRKAPFGCRGPSNISVFFGGPGQQFCCCSAGPVGPAYSSQTAGLDPLPKLSFLKDLCSQMAVCG